MLCNRFYQIKSNSSSPFWTIFGLIYYFWKAKSWRQDLATCSKYLHCQQHRSSPVLCYAETLCIANLWWNYTSADLLWMIMPKKDIGKCQQLADLRDLVSKSMLISLHYMRVLKTHCTFFKVLSITKEVKMLWKGDRVL